MKARNKKTGEVVTSFCFSKEWGTASYIDGANTLRFSTPLDGEWEIIEESEPIDWAAFRREAAKDILAGFAAKIGYPINDHPEQYCKSAIQLADELINQLKEG